jgi:methylmalonyl-CoA mutase
MDEGSGAVRLRPPLRFVTAASLFDGHDAAINLVRRLLQGQGAEVVHLGHNRSVEEVVRAAIDEDVQGVAVSSYQGGHMEYFKYLVDRFRAEDRSEVKVFGGGGGVIVPSEIAELETYGVSHVFSPADGQRLGLEAMIGILIEECDVAPGAAMSTVSLEALLAGDRKALSRAITAIENGMLGSELLEALTLAARGRTTPVLGITGTGGSGKSSLTDEIIRRIRLDHGDKLKLAVFAVDPSKRQDGGAFLGDRIRMNAIDSDQIYFRSLATRGSAVEVPPGLSEMIVACKAAGYDLVIVETPGIGQGDGAIVDVADLSLYVMTPEYGASSQLEKIEMLDLADAVAINKFERFGAKDALRSVERQWLRSHRGTSMSSVSPPIFGTMASRFNDDGVTALYQHLNAELVARGMPESAHRLETTDVRNSSGGSVLLPPQRRHYLAEIAATVRAYRDETNVQAAAARCLEQVRAVKSLLTPVEPLGDRIDMLEAEKEALVAEGTRALLEGWRETRAVHEAEEEQERGAGANAPEGYGRVSLSGTYVPRVALPDFDDAGHLVKWLRSENLPGCFPFTAGVFAHKRTDEDPTRMFAGEGDPFRTNHRLHLLAEGQRSTRLSIAFDSVTLYGHDPEERPDMYGKIGTSGVSVATLDDMKALFEGFDLCDPSTSVSMTINGPAPTILAMFLNTAIDQSTESFMLRHGREPDGDEAMEIRRLVLRTVRGTVQADILKEDQGQNTCIFSTEFSLEVMADIQQYFIEQEMGNFYSVSISGYHIAEAGANPITQLAFTLANAFTYVESYLSRGMAVDDFAPNLSFFFSNGMDAEYNVIGRVARRIWAIAMRDRYGAAERSQKLKYHLQTSGRSLHAQEMSFNDIRTTLQALCAIYDNANSLHTNAYDEAVTTPTAESVRRALAIQLIINKEWGLAMNENPLQGSFIVERLTDDVEAAVLLELDHLSERGGVLGAMETGYQRGKIQDDSMDYEMKKHDGSLPIIGVNTFVNHLGEEIPERIELARATEGEKRGQLQRVSDFRARHAAEAPEALARLQSCALRGGNIFWELMDTVRYASLGQITEALFEVGGSYRRNA